MNELILEDVYIVETGIGNSWYPNPEDMPLEKAREHLNQQRRIYTLTGYDIKYRLVRVERIIMRTILNE